VQVSRLFVEGARESHERRGRHVGAGRGVDHGRMGPQHVEVVQLAEDLLHGLEPGHQRRRRSQAQLPHELERVAQPLGFDPHPVDALDDEHGAGGGNRLVQPARLIDGAGEQDLARAPGQGLARLRVLRAADLLPQSLHQARGAPPIHRLAQPRQRGLPLPFEVMSERRQAGVPAAADMIGEARQGDVELAQRPERAGQLLQPLQETMALAAAERERHRLAQPSGGDPRLVHGTDVALQRGRQIVVERVDAPIDDVGQRALDARSGSRFGWGRGTAGATCRTHARLRIVLRPMRLAAIDIGTNSVHMIVAAVRPDLSFEIVDREKEMVRLGAGGLDGRALTPAAMTAGLQALSKFRRLADSHKVDEIIAAATSATREAENGGDFLAAVRDQTGIDVKVISGTEEARLIHIAAAYGVDLARRRAVVIDIGGGSVEITLGGARDAVLARSFKVGVIRLTERFVRADPLPHRDERRLVKHVEEAIGAHVDQIVARGYQRVIGTSGTILSLGAVTLAAETGHLVEDLHHRRVAAKAIHRVRKTLVASDQAERLQMPGLDPRRADLSVAGAVLLDTILRRLGAEEISLCEMALREGLILDYVRRNRKHIAAVERYPDIRRRSVEELGERCHYWSEHARQVARIAMRLFDQTSKRHGLGPREREWLEFGALLHDVGVHISYRSHHKHSHYLIRHGDLRGFDPEEVEIIALIARYHRQATPKKSHEGYGDLASAERRAVRLLAAFVRLAEGLDRSHAQLVSQITVADDGDGLVIRVEASGDAELEQWAAERYLPPLEGELGCPVRVDLQVAGSRGSPARARAAH